MSKRMEQLLEKQKKLLEKKQQAEAEEKAVQKQIKELTRSERTHRLCSRGATSKSCWSSRDCFPKRKYRTCWTTLLARLL